MDFQFQVTNEITTQSVTYKESIASALVSLVLAKLTTDFQWLMLTNVDIHTSADLQ